MTMSVQIIRTTILFTLLASIHPVIAQQMDLNNVKGLFGKGKPLKLNGGFSAGAVYYTGNGSYGRDPLSYTLNGNLNINILGRVNLPFTFSFTNAGRNFSYPTPPNRLSLHPNYKWIQAHIGDASMTFSPYTLSGHPFTGAGLELSPKGPWKWAVMAGRLQKAVGYDSLNKGMLPVYKRMGYGTKLGFEKEKYKLSAILFTARDHRTSLAGIPDTLLPAPQENVAGSLGIGLQPIRDLRLTIEYAASLFTSDTRAAKNTTDHTANLLTYFMGRRESTNLYKAIKGELSYIFKKSTVGVGYEHIDPGYRTLGAYYFSNDLENMTVNVSQTFLKDKINLSGSLGLQHDDLANAKSSKSSRTVSSLNASYNMTRNLNLNLSYSSFQSYTNIKSYYQQTVDPNNADTLNFTQLSKSANLTLNYMFGQSDKRQQNLNLTLSIQEAADKQGGELYKGNGSGFYNIITAYSISFVPQQIALTSAFNVSYNTIGGDNTLTIGPALGMNARMFHKKVTGGVNASYVSNRSQGDLQGIVVCTRYNLVWQLVKKHSLAVSAISQFRKNTSKPILKDHTITMNYTYSF